MHPPIEIAPGERFGRLVAMEPTRHHGRRAWLCVCDCGVKKLVMTHHLARGRTRSCGCTRVEAARAKNSTHGQTHSPEYAAWDGMIGRCCRKSHDRFPLYGGRGIRVCRRWRRSFEAFFADMGPKPSQAHSIDRIDSNKNYEPGNCRWATSFEQSRNRRSNRMISAFGRTQCLADWVLESGLHGSTIAARLARGMSPEAALSEPPRGAFGRAA